MQDVERVALAKMTRVEAVEAAIHYMARAEKAEAEVARLREALGDVVNPLGHLHRKAESEGKTLGWLACQVANDLGFVQQIARAALEPPQRSNR